MTDQAMKCSNTQIRTARIPLKYIIKRERSTETTFRTTTTEKTSHGINKRTRYEWYHERVPR